MATIKCPECGKEISNTAKVCPNCGYKQNRGNGKKIITIIAVVVLVVIACIAAIYKVYDDMTVTDDEIHDILGEDWEEINQKNAETAEQIEQMRDEAYEAEEQYNDEMRDIEISENIINQLLRRYDELTSKDELTEKEIEQLDNVTFELMRRVPALQDYYNEETGLFMMTSDEVWRIVEDYQE